MLTKEQMTEFLTASGLVVEGDESSRELWDAVKYMRAYLRGEPVAA